jgi:hypothetical protein
VEQLDGKSWAPKLLDVALADLTCTIYSKKAVSTPYAAPEALKKMLRGTFSFATHRSIKPGPVPNSLQFGKTPRDAAFTFKFTDADFPLISRILDVISKQDSQASLDNQQVHALAMITLALPALMSIYEST